MIKMILLGARILYPKGSAMSNPKGRRTLGEAQAAPGAHLGTGVGSMRLDILPECTGESLSKLLKDKIWLRKR
jgi:hypothetical protein